MTPSVRPSSPKGPFPPSSQTPLVETGARARDSREPPLRLPHRWPGGRFGGPGSSRRCSPAARHPAELVLLNVSPQRPGEANTSAAPQPRRKRLSQAAGDGALARLGKRVCNHRPGKRSAAFEPCPAGRVLTSCRDEQAPNIPTCSPRASWEQTGPRHNMGTTELPWMPPSSSSHCIQTLQGQEKQRQAGAYVIHVGTKGWHQEWHHLGMG